MVSIIYNRLFNIRTEHTFYVDGISKDIVLTPTTETAYVMKNCNMLFKMDNTGFRILYKVDESNNPFIDFKDVKLVFGLHIKNTNIFSNITEWATISGYGADKMPYFTNIGNLTTPNLTLSFLDFLKPAVFNYQFPETGTTGETAKIEIFRNGANVTPPAPPDPNAVPVDGSGNFNFPIDFSNMPKGLYEFKTNKNPSGTVTTKTVYIDTDLVKQNVFAIVDILAKDGKPANFATNYPADRTFNLKFNRRVTQWKYIVLLKSFDPMALPTIDILDTNPTQPIYGTINFNPPVDTTINGIPAKIISSTQNKPYFETAKTGLNIRKDPAGTPVTLLANIPGVPLGITSADSANFDITEIFVVI